MTYQKVDLEDVSAMAYLKVKRSYMGILSSGRPFVSQTQYQEGSQCLLSMSRGRKTQKR